MPDPDARAAQLVSLALELACRIRDEDPAETHAALAELQPDDLIALATVMAALIDIDRPVSELLAWTEEPARQWPDTAPEVTQDMRAAHAHHARTPAGQRTPGMLAREREYQRVAKQAARAGRVNPDGQAAPTVDPVAVDLCVRGTVPAGRLSPAERREAVRVLHSRRLDDTEIAARLSLNPGSVCRLRRRMGLAEVWSGQQTGAKTILRQRHHGRQAAS